MYAAYGRARGGRLSNSKNATFDVSAFHVATNARKMRAMRKARISFALALLTLLIVVFGLFTQAMGLVQIYAANKNIRALNAENEIILSRIDNLESEIELETQVDIVYERANKLLGMEYPTKGSVFTLNIDAESSTQVFASVK